MKTVVSVSKRVTSAREGGSTSGLCPGRCSCSLCLVRVPFSTRRVLPKQKVGFPIDI